MKNIKKILLGLLVVMLTLTGCAAKQKQVDLEAVMSEITNEYLSEVMGMMNVDAELIENVYNLTTEDYTNVVGMLSQVTAVNTEIVIFEAAEGKLETVEAAVKARQENAKANAWYPSHQESAEASQVFTVGNYVCFVMAQTADITADAVAYNEEIRAFIEERLK